MEETPEAKRREAMAEHESKISKEEVSEAKKREAKISTNASK